MEHVNRFKNDKRSRKSRQAIKEAFKEMVLTQEMSHIVIKDLAEKADVNRKTFYLHYTDVYNVLEDVEDELLEDIKKIFGKFDMDKIKTDPYPLLIAISEGVTGSENETFNKLLFSSTISGNFLGKIKDMLKKELFNSYRFNSSTAPNVAFILSFIVSGVVDCYRDWYLSDRSESLEELARELSELIKHGVARYFEG